MEFSEKIREAAGERGFSKCGMVSLDRLAGFDENLKKRIESVPSSREFYQGMKSTADLKEKYPWAKSVIVLIYEYSKYRYPASMQGKYGKDFFLHPEEGKADGFDRQSMEKWMTDNGIRWDGREAFPLRFAAWACGLGIIRENNFFYTENGSYLYITGYVTDCDFEIIDEVELPACPPNCGRCRKACKTGTLSAPYTMDPFRCVGFITTFGHGVIPDSVSEKMLEEWVFGCDNCQDACPFNKRVKWDEGEDFADLNELEPEMEPIRLLTQSDEFLREKVIPRTVDHLKPGEEYVLRKNALRSILYHYSKK